MTAKIGFFLQIAKHSVLNSCTFLIFYGNANGNVTEMKKSYGVNFSSFIFFFEINGDCCNFANNLNPV